MKRPTISAYTTATADDSVTLKMPVRMPTIKKMGIANAQNASLNSRQTPGKFTTAAAG